MWFWLFVLLGLCVLYRWYRDGQKLPNFTDKYVFITGCDSGFGHRVAHQLDRQGMRVLAACLTQQGAEQMKKATSQRLQTIILDVTNSESVAAAANWVKQQVGDRGLWGLVNNAGILIPVAPNEWLTKNDFLKILNVNLLGLIDVTLSLLPLIRKAKGRIINVSSIAGRLALCGGGYCISKYGVEAFSDSLRRELHTFGVKVSIINPDFFKTEILNTKSLQENFQQAWSQVPKEIKDSYGEKYFETYCKMIDDMTVIATSKLNLVTDCMEHALTAVHPRTCYAAGWYAKLFYIPLSYLPTMLADYLLSISP
uniref:Retinol dehydrogenase 7-like n=1 Tax=Geotrypetes seraphini TaxID=260995 RepID=A0A6P8Q588_GEOSA|nr:retinol dehydrogenase 7-like [Geotrypetes seraphini]